MKTSIRTKSKRFWTKESATAALNTESDGRTTAWTRIRGTYQKSRKRIEAKDITNREKIKLSEPDWGGSVFEDGKRKKVRRP